MGDKIGEKLRGGQLGEGKKVGEKVGENPVEKGRERLGEIDKLNLYPQTWFEPKYFLPEKECKLL